MLTFRHFVDRPTWAAAAGYDFNFFDCMSYMAIKYDRIFHAIQRVFDDFWSTELREFPLLLSVFVLAVIGVVAWPFIFWMAAIPLWVKCRWMRKHYVYGTRMNDIATNNIARWRAEFEKYQQEAV